LEYDATTKVVGWAKAHWRRAHRPSFIPGNPWQFTGLNRLFCGDAGGCCLVRYDNEQGKGDHVHYGDREQPYVLPWRSFPFQTTKHPHGQGHDL